MQKSYFQDSFTPKKELNQPEIPSNAHLFICDVTPMYTNIRTGPDLQRMGWLALDNEKHLTVAPAALMEALCLLMTNKVFQFRDTYWLHKVGTAMGAPPVPPWATIFFGIHEEAVLAQFGNRLQLYRRFINNVLGICLVSPNPAENHIKWTAFVSLMQDYYGLEWIFEEHSDNVNYMEMTITIRGDRIVTLLYEKLMNVYLHILPHSAHHPGVLTRIVSGNNLWIHWLYSEQEDINFFMN